jgi:hypothetical protein
MLALVVASVTGCASHSEAYKTQENKENEHGSGNDNTFLEDNGNKLSLAFIINDSVVTIGLIGRFMPSIYYREFYRYVAADGSIDTVIEYTPDKYPINPVTGNEFTIHERSEICLYAFDNDGRNIIKVLYTKSGEMLTSNADGYHNPTEGVSVGDTVYALANPRRRIIVTDPDEFESRPLSVYDELLNRLMKVKERYSNAKDADDIIIAVDNGVSEAKITPLISIARTAGFHNISRDKLRS